MKPLEKMVKYQRDLDNIIDKMIDTLDEIAQNILDENENIESVIEAQGLSYIRDNEDNEVSIEEFPAFSNAMDIWDEYFMSQPGIYVVRENVE